MELRDYQQLGVNEISAAWQMGHRNVLYVLPTGGGKTCTFAHVIHAHQGTGEVTLHLNSKDGGGYAVGLAKTLASYRGASCAIAHRQELVSQISLALARENVVHKIIGPESVVKAIVHMHIEEFGRSFYDPKALCAVAGVDTLISWSKPEARQHDALHRWATQVTLVVQDEAHHLLRENKWGKALALFPNAYLLGVTATPERADGKGLGRHADGVFDYMVVGPTMRDLITRDYLTDYRIFCPPSNLDLGTVSTGTDGDYIRKQLALKTKESTVLGDVVEHYLRLAPGKLGVTFVPDVETATEMAYRFNVAGVPAEVVTAKTPDRQRRAILKRFARRELLQLANVDLFGEGFDLPAIEVVSMARATQSYALFVQQFGRSLRILYGKDRAIIIDHVGNVLRHGLPDAPRVWTLDRRDKRASVKADDIIPLRNCTGGVYEDGSAAPGCFQPYEAFHPACPYCGCKRVPTVRTAPEHVDGDLVELDPATLAVLRGEAAAIDRDPNDVMLQYGHMGSVIAYSQAKRHAERRIAQGGLRDAIGWWAAWQNALGRSDSEGYRRFWFKFGTDVLTAQTLGRGEAEELQQRVAADVARLMEEYGRVAA